MRHYLILGLRTLATMLMGVLLLSAGGALVLAALGFVPELDVKWSGLELKLNLLSLAYEHRMKWLGAGALAFLLGTGAIVISLARMFPAKPRDFILKSSVHHGAAQTAQVTLSRRGMTALVAYIVESITGVYDAKPSITLNKKGWHIDCMIAVWGSANLPEVIAQVEEKLQHEVSRHTGIHVQHIDLHAQYEALTHAERRQRVQ